MRLSFMEIVNFRGITQLRLDLEPETTVLFGENAWGKTTLSEALQSTLGKRTLQESDFHRLANRRSTIAKHMNITLGFKGEPGPQLEQAGWRDEAGTFHLVLQWAGRRLDRGRCRIRRHFLGPDGREMEMAAGDTAILADRVVKRHPLYVFRELRLAEWMLQPALRTDLQVNEAPERAMGRVFERLLTLPHQVHPSELARGLEALHRLAEQRPELFPSVALGGHVLRRASDMAETPIETHDGRSLADLAQRAGSGMRQVILLALMGAMLQAEAAVPRSEGAEPLLLLEDPETHLHPIQLAIAWNLVRQFPIQKIVTTAQGSLMASVPLRSLRRLVRRIRYTDVFPSQEAYPLSPVFARRVAFHVRTHNADSLFARVWLLVEGETEAWLLPELGRVQGLSFPLEGIHCVPFAQAGLDPLIAFADRFGIPWHLVADGDDAGKHYIQRARKHLRGREENNHITQLPDLDMEHFLWKNGFASVYQAAAGPLPRAAVPLTPEAKIKALIRQALKAKSKPGMALEVAEAAVQRGPKSVPGLLRKCFATLRRLAAKA